MSGRTLLSAGRAMVLPLLATLVVATSVPARAEGDTIEKRLWVATGSKAVTVDRFREMREDCALAPAPVVTVLQHPAFGKASVKSVKAAGKTDPSGPYAACDGKPFNWTTVTVPAPAKGQGTDKLVIQAQESSGESTTYDVEIVFAKKLPAGKTSGLLEDR